VQETLQGNGTFPSELAGPAQELMAGSVVPQEQIIPPDLEFFLVGHILAEPGQDRFSFTVAEIAVDFIHRPERQRNT